MQKLSIFSFIIKHFSIITKFLVMLLIAFSAIYIYSSVQNLQNEEKNKLNSTSIIINRAISSNIGYSVYQIYYVAKQISKTGGDKEKINQILSNYKSDSENYFEIVTNWNMYSWIDHNNQLVVNGFEGVLKKTVDLSDRDYLPITRKNPGRVVFGQPVLGTISKRQILPLSIGVADNNGKFLGTVVFSIDIDKLFSQIRSAVKDDPINFLIIDQDEKLFFKSSLIGDEEMYDLFKQIDLQNDYNRTIFKDKIYNFGNGLFAKINKIEDFGSDVGSFYLLVINDNSLFKKIINDLILQKFLICLIVIFLGIFVINRIYYRIVRPIKLLSNYAKNIGEHKYYNLPPEDLGSKEFKDLYSALSSIENHLKTEQSLKIQLYQANQRLQTLTKSVSHDLRNYISGIIGVAKIISEDEKISNVAKQYARMIVSQSGVMLNFSKSLLDDNGINKTIESTISAHNLEEDQDGYLDIVEMTNDLVFLLKPLMQSHEVSVKINVDQENFNHVNVKIDFIELRKILDNLITNAIKYSRIGGEVVITIKQFDENIKNNTIGFYVQISDQGIGMNKEELDYALSGQGRIIDKSSLNKEIDSHGLGVPIVCQAVRNLGAKMEIESKKNEGTTVKLWFKNLEIGHKTKAHNSSKTVLLADDEELILVATVYQLKALGFNVLTAKSGDEVIKILDNNKCDIVLIDTNMNEIRDGFRTVQTIRKGSVFKNFKDFKKIPIIGFSSSCDTESRDLAFKSGMNDYLEKPFNKKIFLNVVNLMFTE